MTFRKQLTYLNFLFLTVIWGLPVWLLCCKLQKTILPLAKIGKNGGRTHFAPAGSFSNILPLCIFQGWPLDSFTWAFFVFWFLIVQKIKAQRSEYPFPHSLPASLWHLLSVVLSFILWLQSLSGVPSAVVTQDSASTIPFSCPSFSQVQMALRWCFLGLSPSSIPYSLDLARKQVIMNYLVVLLEWMNFKLFLGLLFSLLKIKILKQSVVGLVWILCLSGMWPAHCFEKE